MKDGEPRGHRQFKQVARYRKWVQLSSVQRNEIKIQMCDIS